VSARYKPPPSRRLARLRLGPLCPLATSHPPPAASPAGPGTYEPSATHHGAPLSPGSASPAFSFPGARKGLSAASHGAALPVLSREALAREYLGVGSPGPAR
jgi:hypothetical protein